MAMDTHGGTGAGVLPRGRRGEDPPEPDPNRGPGEDPQRLEGQVLAGTWRVARCIGRGGMGRVYEAVHARLDRSFALKIIHEHHFPNRDAVLRFQREARAAARIRSEHVLDVVDLFQVPDGRPCLVAEHLEGEDLQTRLDREGRLSVPDAVALGRQLCRGLADAHAHGVIHRDVKPSNLFLARTGDGRITLKILDFGVAKVVGDPSITRAGAVVGTPAYMPPEQALGKASADVRADVYGAAAVVYRMVSGQAPYDGSKATEVLAAVADGPPRDPRTLATDLPEALADLLTRALSRNPDDRPADAAELGAQLEACWPGTTDGEPAGEAAPAPAPTTGGVGQAGPSTDDLSRRGDRPADHVTPHVTDPAGPVWSGAAAAPVPGGPTLVLPGGAVAEAGRRAAAIVLGDAGVLPSLVVGAASVGAAVAGALGATLLALGEPVPFARGPRLLLGGFGLAAAAITLGELGRAARRVRSRPARRGLARRVRVGVAAGAGFFAAAELAARLAGAAGPGIPLASPAGTALRLGIAIVVGLLGYGAAQVAPPRPDDGR